MHKIGFSGGFLGRLLGPLIKTGLPLGPLPKTGLPLNVLKPLAKSVLIPLGLIAAGSATGEAIYQKIFASVTTTWIIFNEENDIMKIIKYI